MEHDAFAERALGFGRACRRLTISLSWAGNCKASRSASVVNIEYQRRVRERSGYIDQQHSGHVIPISLLRIENGERLMAYSEQVVDHYEHPRNVGSFDKGDAGVGTGFVGAPACGDVMKLQIKVSRNGVIEDAKFKTFGCGSAIASSSLVTEWVKGKTLDEAVLIKNTQIAQHLSLPPVKIHCSVLAEDAIKAAVADYRKKNCALSD